MNKNNKELFSGDDNLTDTGSRGLLDDILQRDLEAVRRVSLEALSAASPKMRLLLEESILSSGKMLRPALVLIAGRYGNFDSAKLYNLAAAVEMLHNATLIHDDIIDHSSVRRGRPALHSTYGHSQAVLMGDFLLSSSFILAAGSTTESNGISLAHAVARICEGEINQNENLFGTDFSIRSYRRRIAGKTAALFAVSLLAGASESGVGKKSRSLFVRIGYNIGMSFQIIDDILDYTGDGSKVGKPLGNDLSEGIYTLPLLFALKNGNKQTDLSNIISDSPYCRETVNKIIEIVIELGGVELARKEAALYTRRAKREVSNLKAGFSRKVLSEIIDELLLRDR